MIDFSMGHAGMMFRAVALIRRDTHILIQRDLQASNWALPGGRIAFRETGAEALTREMKEELGSDVVVGNLRLIIENFYPSGSKQVHSVGLYYDVTLDSTFAFHEEHIVHRCRDGEANLEFRWTTVQPDSLAKLDLRPQLLTDLLDNMPPGVAHRISCR